MKNAKGNQSGRVYDFIIVGAGSAGCALAEGLSADGRFDVLLIEDGPADSSPMLAMPKGFGAILGRDSYVSKFPVARGEGEPDNEVWLRGKTLGGSSSVNGMTWVRCQPEDFDALAGAGNTGWSWSEMSPHFAALDGGGNNRGIIKVNRYPVNYPIGDAFIESGRQLGLPLKEHLDALEQRGIGYLHSNIDRRGRRSSAATGFLKPALGRPNLRAETGVRVDKLIFDGKKAVAAAGRKKGRAVRFHARREIILSAGALESPAILQRSGVGPAGLLRSLGIDVVHDSPGVGGNMREHMLLSVNFEVKSWDDTENREYSGARLIWNVLRYLVAGKGPMAQAPFHAAAFTSTGDHGLRPDVQLMLGPFSRKGQVFDDFPGINIFGYMLRPQSIGSLRISAADPDAPPRIVPNYLDHERDRETCIAMVRTIRKLASQPPLASRIVREIAPTADAQTDAEILEVYRRHGRSAYHATGTCSMGQGELAVVDERTRVRGVQGLRVVDCAIYPEMLSGNLNAPTMAVAMRAAELILADQ